MHVFRISKTCCKHMEGILLNSEFDNIQAKIDSMLVPIGNLKNAI